MRDRIHVDRPASEGVCVAGPVGPARGAAGPERAARLAQRPCSRVAFWTRLCRPMRPWPALATRVAPPCRCPPRQRDTCWRMDHNARGPRARARPARCVACVGSSARTAPLRRLSFPPLPCAQRLPLSPSTATSSTNKLPKNQVRKGPASAPTAPRRPSAPRRAAPRRSRARRPRSLADRVSARAALAQKKSNKQA